MTPVAEQTGSAKTAIRPFQVSYPEAKLAEMRSERIELPLVIGSEEVRTGDTFEAVMPHAKEHVLADVHHEIAPMPPAPLVYRWPLTPQLEVELRFLGGEVTAEALERLLTVGGNEPERRRLALAASQTLAADAVLRVVQASAGEGRGSSWSTVNLPNIGRPLRTANRPVTLR